jgi:hypothetical protein
MKNNDNSLELFTIENKDFGQLYKLVDTILETRPDLSQEYVAATALKHRLDEAIDTNEDKLIFNENEVVCLTHVVS